MKKLLLVPVLLLVSCATLTPFQGALIVDASTLAQVAGTAVATYYGGAAGGTLASAGLSALGYVFQGYVGSKIPGGVVTATPGVGNLGTAVVGLFNLSKPVTQTDVTKINAAAAILSGTN